MKNKKKLNKKLTLNKKTVANLNLSEMTGLYGGGITEDVTCITCDGPFCEPSTKCTGTYCHSCEPNCTFAETCEGWTCDYPNTCGYC